MCLHRISQIRQFVDKATSEKLLHAYISCKLDFCNALLYSLSSNHLGKVNKRESERDRERERQRDREREELYKMSAVSNGQFEELNYPQVVYPA